MSDLPDEMSLPGISVEATSILASYNSVNNVKILCCSAALKTKRLQFDLRVQRATNAGYI